MGTIYLSPYIRPRPPPLLPFTDLFTLLARLRADTAAESLRSVPFSGVGKKVFGWGGRKVNSGGEILTSTSKWASSALHCTAPRTERGSSGRVSSLLTLLPLLPRFPSVLQLLQLLQRTNERTSGRMNEITKHRLRARAARVPGCGSGF